MWCSRWSERRLRRRSWEFLSLPNCTVEVLVHARRYGLVVLISNVFAYHLRVQEAVTANAAMPLVAGEGVRTPLGAFRVVFGHCNNQPSASALFDDDVLPLNITERAQPATEPIEVLFIRTGCAHESNAGDLGRLLRARRERPRRRPAEQGDELAPSYT